MEAYREISHYTANVETSNKAQIAEEFATVSTLYKYYKWLLVLNGELPPEAAKVLASDSRNIADHITVPKGSSSGSSSRQLEEFAFYVEDARSEDGIARKFTSKMFSPKFSLFSKFADRRVVNCDRSQIYRIYDENGKPHKFNKREGGKLLCSVCGVASDFVPADPVAYSANVLAKLIAEVDITSFYNMYTNRCPSGGIHSWDKTKCSKCGMTAADATNNDVKFYEKHKAMFERDRRRAHIATSDTSVYTLKDQKIEPVDIDALFQTLKNMMSKHIADFTNTTRAANMAVAIISHCEQINNRTALNVSTLVNFATKHESFKVDNQFLIDRFKAVKAIADSSTSETNTLYLAAIIEFFIHLLGDRTPAMVAFVELNIHFIKLDSTFDEKTEFYAPKSTEEEMLDSEDTAEAYIDVNPFDTENIDMTAEELEDNGKPGDD